MIKLRLRNVKNAHEKILKSSYVIHEPEKYQNNFAQLFANKNAIHLEIGTGKGQFIYEMAKIHPDINFIGLEKYESVIIRALEKMEKEPLPNLKFIVTDAKNLENIFSREISCLYLNFSDPWPKNRHANRRLTSDAFLKIYDGIFKDEKLIIQKTDNLILFASSLKSLNNYGYTFLDISLDLANSDIENIETEYEQKFKNLGYKINYLKAIKK